jgi:hypothetical protein
MIESEEKKERLTETITYWCENTKISPYLRNYDIPNLVRQIMAEFYHVTLCCGHMVSSFEEGVLIAFKDMYDGEKCETQGFYCKQCAEKYKREIGAWEVETRSVKS